MTKTLDVFWYKDNANFGDALNMSIFPHYGFQIRHVRPEESSYIGIGSILSLVPANYAGTILGAGFMWEQNKQSFAHAELKIVRGKLTADRCSPKHAPVLGDPGLLASKLFNADASNCKYRLGIIPHCVEQNDARVKFIKERYPDEISVIDITQQPLEFIKSVSECENIASSALHGLIAADSLLKPNIWLSLSDKVYGYGFKFRDYFSGVSNHSKKRTAFPLIGDETLHSLIENAFSPGQEIVEKIEELDDLFSNLSSCRE